jgi:hypothetical protein
MEKWKSLSGAGLLIMVLWAVWLVLPAAAQVQQPAEEATSEPLIRVVVADLTVQGEQTPEAVREGFNAILPQVVDCIEKEYERVKKLPRKIMLRLNLSSNGKVAWSKVVDPPLKSLDACIAKVLHQMQLPPAGTSLTRVTVVLETRTDHLLSP